MALTKRQFREGLMQLYSNNKTSDKKSKHQPLTSEQKQENQELARQRIYVEHVIGKLKVFRILSERYLNLRKRFALRFNLIAAIYNLEIT